MTLLLQQTRIRRTGRVNALVMLLMLFVVGGHCSVAMAKVQLESGPQTAMSAMPAHGGHCEAHVPVDNLGDSDHCMDDTCPNSATLLQSQGAKINLQKADQLAWVAPLAAQLPPVRAGPCGNVPFSTYDIADTPSAPLYYRLCVLRL